MSIPDLHQLFLECDGISTDTRKIRRDSLFIALKGEHFDGNTFVKEALEKGAMAALVSDDRLKGTDDRIVVVTDTLATLQELALYHRRQFVIPLIGITGTNGKTTTKELIAEVLEEKYKVIKTEGNLNNHIGVPLTLLRIRKSTEIAIIEMGASHINDIRELCAIAEPTHGLITNIGSAHLEGFGSKEGVAKAKGALYEWLRDHKGTVFINKNDPDLPGLLYSIDPGYQAETIRYEDEEVPVSKHLFGNYNKINMKAAAAIGHYFKVTKVSINKALKQYEPKNMRSQMLVTEKGNEIILDAYNANPSSMTAVMESFSSFETGKPKWLILGDMKELGEHSCAAHTQVLKDLTFYGLSNVILIGESFNEVHAAFRRFASFKTTEDFLASPFASSIKNAAVLIKGSNGMKMWEIADYL
jgi:UDP-N-acetylmuramoyl-tripeptide--D-alanyl-D-alanine ligase